MEKFRNFIRENVLQSFVILSLVLNFGSGTFELIKENEAPPYLNQMVNQVKIIYNYNVNEMVRFVEKQYTKVTENPDDFYPSDLVYLIDKVWPYIPEDMKKQALTTKYEYLLDYYKSQMTGYGFDNGIKFSELSVLLKE